MAPPGLLFAHETKETFFCIRHLISLKFSKATNRWCTYQLRMPSHEMPLTRAHLTYAPVSSRVNGSGAQCFSWSANSPDGTDAEGFEFCFSGGYNAAHKHMLVRPLHAKHKVPRIGEQHAIREGCLASISGTQAAQVATTSSATVPLLDLLPVGTHRGGSKTACQRSALSTSQLFGASCFCCK
jgi:hypothetical protein